MIKIQEEVYTMVLQQLSIVEMKSQYSKIKRIS